MPYYGKAAKTAFSVCLLGARIAESQTVSLSDCLKLAEARSPQIVQSDLENQRAVEALRGLSRQRLPQLSFVGTIAKSDDPRTQLPDANKAVGRVEQSLYPFSESWLRTEQKSAELVASQFTRIEARQDVRLLVKQTYFSILRDGDAVESSRKVEEELRRLLGSVVPRYSISQAPPFDSVKVRLAIADLTRAIETARAQMVGEKKQLAVILGLGLDAELELPPLTARPVVPAGTPEWDKNPTLQALGAQIQAADLGIRAAKWGRAPSLLGAVEYGYTGQTANTMTLGWDISLGVKLPLFDWGVTSSLVAQEEVLSSVARVKREVQRKQLEVEAIGAREMARVHLSDEDRLKTLLPDVRRSAEVAVERYRKGVMSILEATDAVNLWLQTLLNERSAYYAALFDVARIERLEGRDLPEGGHEH